MPKYQFDPQAACLDGIHAAYKQCQHVDPYRRSAATDSGEESERVLEFTAIGGLIDTRRAIEVRNCDYIEQMERSN